MHLKPLNDLPLLDPQKEPPAVSVSITETPTPAPRPLYFAYGSNLSPTQMRLRCTANPARSAKPLAIARLDHWRWMICQAGYANVLPPAGLRVGQQVRDGEHVPVSGAQDAVFGVLYAMDPDDEFLLDGYEGVDHAAPGSRGSGPVPVEVRPREQGVGDYNKWYVPAVVARWLDEDPARWVPGVGESGASVVTVLVYVDENRVRLGPPKEEYIPRMNRAIREAEAIGFPKEWADEVMRKSIPLN
ncbi:gamma-glutamylcyclotransferase family protein [Aspergillus clavatus NRRL 1]|uniref:gamma-glutamylcyclotransferase n=1 Tax=Aspergillus clavatus (strain ATCC 1007 / CBS 513.65 / DSM 816 / NCTC 3887 / NRRL 1 / QM 1276 / 107) TaxID=344612 RepID=A1CG08_ASPCL|nr:uncharacterized protein ACLA_065220 [Aspergillus clavatus NRRL 1]EAW10888.1 conserved hypothetical protein [Aspergillus clavatus NRRL 1]